MVTGLLCCRNKETSGVAVVDLFNISSFNTPTSAKYAGLGRYGSGDGSAKLVGSDFLFCISHLSLIGTSNTNVIAMKGHGSAGESRSEASLEPMAG